MIDLPKKIGRYGVFGLTGQGGKGEIYIATDPSLDRKVAADNDRIAFASERAGY